MKETQETPIESWVRKIPWSRKWQPTPVFLPGDLNYFSGSLPNSSSFIWTTVFLVCFFICAVFLCLFNIFKLLCLRSPFPGFQES